MKLRAGLWAGTGLSLAVRDGEGHRRTLEGVSAGRNRPPQKSRLARLRIRIHAF